jgi:hypothetical protein
VGGGRRAERRGGGIGAGKASEGEEWRRHIGQGRGCRGRGGEPRQARGCMPLLRSSSRSGPMATTPPPRAVRRRLQRERE